MSLPAIVNQKVYRGDTWSADFRFRNGATPIDLTGATVEAEARGPDGATHALDVATDTGTSVITISLPTESLPPSTYNYDIKVTDANGPKTWVRGRMIVFRNVTNELPV
jgi:hypothetical protein